VRLGRRGRFGETSAGSGRRSPAWPWRARVVAFANELLGHAARTWLPGSSPPVNPKRLFLGLAGFFRGSRQSCLQRFGLLSGQLGGLLRQLEGFASMFVCGFRPARFCPGRVGLRCRLGRFGREAPQLLVAFTNRLLWRVRFHSSEPFSRDLSLVLLSAPRALTTAPASQNFYVARDRDATIQMLHFELCTGAPTLGRGCPPVRALLVVLQPWRVLGRLQRQGY
jgi:hypothetical protein